MQSASRYILAVALSSLALSMLYFLSLTVHAPMLVTVSVVLVSVPGIFYFVARKLGPADDSYPHWIWGLLILLLGIYMILTGFCPLAEKYGGWDAWGIWNLHARYLADADNWKKMFENSSFAHPDYPLYIPAFNAFFVRLCSGRHLMEIPFVLQFAITLFIPVLIYLETVKKNMVIAAAVFMLFALDTFYITKGATQYADTPLAFFLLCAFVCIGYAQQGSGYVLLAAASLAGCIWTKNEGAILAAVFIACYIRTFLSRRNIVAFCIGFGLPLLVYLLFKKVYAPDAAIISGQGRDSFKQLFIKERYDMVWDFFKDNVKQKYYYVKICLFLYLTFCMVERRWPDKQFFVLLLCTLAYVMIYILTPGSIEWLLGTSQERLMHQLMPALMFVFAQRFARLRFSLPQQQPL